MITKVLFTLLVIVVVALVFRNKTAGRAKREKPPEPVPMPGGVQAKHVIYAILGLVIAISALLFVLHWQDQHRIVNIHVTDAGGNSVSYQAYKKSIEGRRFETLDGREVTLGDSDRMEMDVPD